MGAFAQEAEFIGRWYCISFVYEGDTYMAADVDFEVVFDLHENGTAELTLTGETEPVSWHVEDGAPVVTAADSAYVFKRNEDMLEMTDGGVLMSFGREPGTAQDSQTGATAFDYVMDDDKPQKPVWTETTITGDANFTKKTQKAMDLIKKSQFGYELATSYIAVIEQSTYSGMRAYDNPPTYQVGEATYNASTTWYASTIIHDAFHSKLYFDSLEEYGYVNSDMWTGQIPEMMCLSAQIDFLKEIGAPRNEIDYAISIIDSHYWDIGDRWW